MLGIPGAWRSAVAARKFKCLQPIHQELFGGPHDGVSEPVQLEVIDRTTAEGLTKPAR